MTLHPDGRTDPTADRVDLRDNVLIPAALFLLAWAVYAWLNHGQEAQLDYFTRLPMRSCMAASAWT